jgi:LPS export ABC transporter protein LptC
MKFRQNAIWLVPLIAIVTFPIWSIPVGNFLAPRGGFDNYSANSEEQQHNFNMDKVQVLQNQLGKTTALIRATHAQTTDNPDILEMTLVDADIYDENGNITKIIARKGTYDTVTKLLTLTKDVIVNKTVDKQFLYTDLLFYNSDERTVKCPGKTRLEGEDVQIDGGSFEYDIKTQTYILDSGVECVLNGFLRP